MVIMVNANAEWMPDVCDEKFWSCLIWSTNFSADDCDLFGAHGKHVCVGFRYIHTHMCVYLWKLRHVPYFHMCICMYVCVCVCLNCI
jgi:hypothetical protein